MDHVQRAYLLRSLCFFDALGYAPGLAEWMQSIRCPVYRSQEVATVGIEGFAAVVEQFVTEGVVKCIRGRYGFPEQVDEIVRKIEQRDQFQARKYRRARLVARWLSFFSGVRFVALANTTAWGYARDESDIDFFVVVRKRSLWSIRLWGVLPFKLLGWLPGPREKADAVCLSYFVADDGLDLSSHQLLPNDPYYSYWFLALLPIVDDGIGEILWKANQVIVSPFPMAKPWVVPEDLRVKPYRFCLPSFRWFELLAERVQRAWFPERIRQLINVDTRVMVNEHVLKFHTDDAREEYRKRFEEICKQHGL